MSFHEVLFPPEISYGSSGGPRFKTTVFTADSGYEQRNIDWSQTRAEYDVSHGIKTQAQMDALTKFFFARRGRAFGFRFKDFNDFKIVQQTVAIGNGEDNTYQIMKPYTSAQTESGESYTFWRKIRKIAWETVAGVSVGVSNLNPGQWSVDADTGMITIAGGAVSEGTEIKIGYAEFHVPVRFDTDHLDAQHEFWMTQSWNSIPLVEVRDWGELDLS